MQNQEVDQDVVRRNVKRELPCKLTEAEFTRISRQRVAKEAEHAQLEGDLAREKKKRQDQIDEIEDEIAKMGRELHTEHQDRTVPCNDVFRRADDGTGWIHTIRMDTYDEVERRPATAHETQRYLPTIDGGSNGILDQSRAAQRSAQVETAPTEDATPEGDDVPPDAGGDEGDEPDTDDAPTKAKKRSGKAKGK